MILFSMKMMVEIIRSLEREMRLVTVYIFELSDGFDGSTSFAVGVDPDTVLNWNEANSADQSFNFTAFAIDSSNAGTTASNEFALTTTITKSSDNDPIIIDLDGGGLNDNFNVSAKNYDYRRR